MTKLKLLVLASLVGCFGSQALQAASSTELELTKCVPQPFSGGIISEPGLYCLTADLSSGDPVPMITIASSNVVLDLAGHTVNSSCQTDLNGAIFFDETAIYSNVTIKNGFITGPGTFTSTGIYAKGSLKNIRFESLNCSGFNTSISVEAQIFPAITNGVVFKNCTLASNYTNGLVLANVTDALIQECSMLSNVYGISMNTCSDVVVQNSLMNANFWTGINCSSCRNILIESSQCNDTLGEYGSENGGMIVTYCRNIQLNNSQFCGTIQNPGRSSSGLRLVQSENILITNCCFNENMFIGIVGGSGVKHLTVINSQAHGNYKYGFDLKDSTETSFTGCKAYKNGITGFRVSGNTELTNCTACENGEGEGEGAPAGQAGFLLDNADAVMRNCSATHNNAAGFDVNGGTNGLIKDCIAVGNGSCGFNSADNNTTYLYISNLAKNNGLTPASASNDTNYCVANAGTALLSAPFNQISQSAATSSLNNITA